jgi:hypothetical protein
LAVAEVLCPRCGAAVPFTGAFAFVLCPNDRTVIYLSYAVRAPTGSANPGAITLPAASAFLPPDLVLPPPVHIVRRIARAASIAGTALTFFILISELAALLIGAPEAWAYASSTGGQVVAIFVVFPVPILLGGLGGEAAALWYSLLLGTIVLSAAFLFRAHLGDAWAKFLRTVEGQGAPPLSEPNALFAMARLFSLSIFSAVLVNYIAEALGSSPRLPAGLESEPVAAQLITLAHASVWEELITRVLLLGVPLLIIHYFGRGRLEKPARRYVLGGGFALDGPVVGLILFQAAIFAAAHVPGWDLWKFPSAFITGMALGLLFVRYGLMASILVHFLADYLGPTIALAGQTDFPLLILLAFYVLLAVGAVQAIRYLFVLQEIIALGRIPEYMGGPVPIPPAPPLPLAAFGLAPVAVPPVPQDALSGPGRPPSPPGGAG